MTPLKRLLTCLLALGLLTSILPGRPAEAGRFDSKVDPIDAAKGEAILKAFRQQRLKGDYVFYFDLVNLPRRGEKSTYEGILWGTWVPEGPLTRAVIWEPGKERAPFLQLLALGGTRPRVWIWEAKTDERRELSEKELFEPLLPNNNYSAFDLLMPFAYWDDYRYEGSRRIKGQATHEFLMLPPEAIKKAQPEIGGARIALDTNFNSLVRAKLLNPQGEDLQTIEILNFVKIDDQYIVKQIDLMDEATRDKSRFKVIGAAVGQELDPKIFNPKFIKYIPDTREIPFKGV